MTPINLLIFPASSEIALEVLNALKKSKFVNIYGGTSSSDHAEFVYQNIVPNIPFYYDENFVDGLNEKIKEYNIEYIFPTSDPVHYVLMENADKIKAKIVSAPFETVKICRSKKDTYSYLKDYDFIPKTFEGVDDVTDYPIFVKPAKSQGSIGAKLIHSKEELILALQEDDSLVLAEHLSGEEFTVDCFTDSLGQLKVCKLRTRERIKSGIAVRSTMKETPDEVMEIASTINSKFKFMGAWFFQLKKDKKGKLKLLEISPRIPGTMGLSRNCGINFPLLTLFSMQGVPADIIDNEYDIMLDRAFYSAYKIDIKYDYVYLDFDDTLIINDRVNKQLIMLLYQWAEEGKKVILISKHLTDIYVDLEKYRIDKNLFDKIIVIPRSDEKVNYITNNNSIFIDDSYGERIKVKNKIGIPVFDVDMTESLLDWRKI